MPRLSLIYSLFGYFAFVLVWSRHDVRRDRVFLCVYCITTSACTVGVHVGDQVLAINGVSTSGPNTDGSGIFDILLATPYKRLYWQLLTNT
jgi:hypothetical protein